MSSTIPSGVITGKQVQEVFALAKEKKFALPARFLNDPFVFVSRIVASKLA